MQWLIDFFSSIGSMLKSLIDFISGAFQGLISIVTSLPSYVSFITDTFSNLPPAFSASLAVGLTVTIIFLALGRGQGGD